MSGKHRAPTDTGATFSGDEDPFADAGEAPQPKGAVYDWTIREYLAHPAPSRSTLWKLWSESPYDWKWGKENNEDKETDAMLLGSAIHLAVLEPELFQTLVEVWPTTRRGKEWDEAKANADASGAMLLTPAQYARAVTIRDWIVERKGIRRIFSTGQAEKSLLWTDPSTGVELLARPDFIDEQGRIFDIKTTNDLGPLRDQPWKLMRKVREFGYHVQAAMMLDGANACGIPATEVHLFWVRSVGAPWARVTHLDEHAINEGRAIYREAAEMWKKANETGDWPTPEFKFETMPWDEKL